MLFNYLWFHTKFYLKMGQGHVVYEEKCDGIYSSNQFTAIQPLENKPHKFKCIDYFSNHNTIDIADDLLALFSVLFYQ